MNWTQTPLAAGLDSDKESEGKGRARAALRRKRTCAISEVATSSFSHMESLLSCRGLGPGSKYLGVSSDGHQLLERSVSTQEEIKVSITF